MGTEQWPPGRAQDTLRSPLKLGRLNSLTLPSGFLLAQSFPEISLSHPQWGQIQGSIPQTERCYLRELALGRYLHVNKEGNG